MNNIRVVIFVLIVNVSRCLLGAESRIDTILSASASNIDGATVNHFDFDRLNKKSPDEVLALLTQEAYARAGSKAGKIFICSAALMEVAHVTSSQVTLFKSVEKWFNNNDAESFDAKLIKVFSNANEEPSKRIADLQFLITEFGKVENDEKAFKLRIYGAVLTYGDQNNHVITLLKLKQIEAMLSQGNIESAEQKLKEVGSIRMPDEYSEYVSGLRLMLKLQKNDAILFKRK